MSLYAEFTFDRAGQGLFYHGHINGDYQSFSVVFDCGTSCQIKGARQHLSEIVSKYHQRQREGLLVISHFDFDHVSHIPELLKKGTFSTIMIPHIALELRAVLLAKSAFEAQETGGLEISSDLVRLFRDPVGYFSDLSGTEQIVGIQGDDDDYDTNNNENLEEPFRPNDSISNEEYPHLRYVGGGRQILTEDNRIDRFFLFSGSPIFRLVLNTRSWIFKPLNVQEKLPSRFMVDVNKILHTYEDDWLKLLADKYAIRQLAEIYDLYIGRGCRNAHSLLLRHEPEQQGTLSLFDCECFEHRYQRHCCNNSATILLGDLEIDGKARAVLYRHRFMNNKAGIVLIPHHGANSNDLLWLDQELRHQCCCTELVVSYGTENKYKDKSGHPHPRFIYDGTMAKVRNKVAFVNENEEFNYRVFVHD